MQLLTSYKLGNIELKNRMVMAPMTRSRSFSKGLATDLMAEYYAQRASAGLILSEAINISADAIGSPFTPGLYTAEQVESWKKVTDAVHKKGGVIFAQLWHTGRVAHSVDRNGVLPVAPSAVKIEGMQHFTSQGVKDYETPREMSIADIRQTIADYTHKQLKTPLPQALTVWNCTRQTATCHSNSCPIPPTCAQMNTAAASKTKHASP